MRAAFDEDILATDFTDYTESTREEKGGEKRECKQKLKMKLNGQQGRWSTKLQSVRVTLTQT